MFSFLRLWLEGIRFDAGSACSAFQRCRGMAEVIDKPTVPCFLRPGDRRCRGDARWRASHASHRRWRARGTHKPSFCHIPRSYQQKPLADTLPQDQRVAVPQKFGPPQGQEAAGPQSKSAHRQMGVPAPSSTDLQVHEMGVPAPSSTDLQAHVPVRVQSSAVALEQSGARNRHLRGSGSAHGAWRW